MMTLGEFMRAIAASGETGLSRAEMATLSPYHLRYLRTCLHDRLVEQVGTGQGKRYRIIDPSYADAIAPQTADNVRLSEEAEDIGADDCEHERSCG